MSDTMPEFIDEYFRKKPKKSSGEYKIVDSPCTFVPIADTHAHLDMMQNPALSLARAGAHKVGFIETMVDPLGDEGLGIFDELDEWIKQANLYIRNMSTRICGQGWNKVPKVRISIGVHPHVSKDFNDDTAELIKSLSKDVRVSAIGEIGLDYHYDMSDRATQQNVFITQLELAKVMELPVILHIREAFDDAFDIVSEVGVPKAGVLLHCYTSDENEIERWVELGAYVAFGGALTFKKSEDIRKAIKLVPKDRLLLETDAPFMTPEPFRGMTCEPAHVIWTAERAYIEYCSPEDNDSPSFEYSSDSDDAKREFMNMTYENALRLLDRPPTKWQTSKED